MSEFSPPGSELPTRSPDTTSSKQFLHLMRANSEFIMKKPTVEGVENYYKVPRGVKLVMAGSHRSDVDLQAIASVMGKVCDVGVASQATNQTAFKPFVNYAGSENFYDIDNRFINGKEVYDFNPDNFTRMEEGLQKGKTMLVAAHRPTHDWKLPERPGLGAAYLAQLGDKYVLPVTLVVDSTEPVGQANELAASAKRFLLRKRPDAKVVIGEPLQLEAIPREHLQAFIKLFKADQRHTMTTDEYLVAKETLTQLKEQSALIMQSIAEPLPEEAKGVWATPR